MVKIEIIVGEPASGKTTELVRRAKEADPKRELWIGVEHNTPASWEEWLELGGVRKFIHLDTVSKLKHTADNSLILIDGPPYPIRTWLKEWIEKRDKFLEWLKRPDNNCEIVITCQSLKLVDVQIRRMENIKVTYLE